MLWDKETQMHNILCLPFFFLLYFQKTQKDTCVYVCFNFLALYLEIYRLTQVIGFSLASAHHLYLNV